MEEKYIKVAYVGLLEGKEVQAVPIYIKINGREEMLQEERELANRISTIFVDFYKNQITHYLANKGKGDKNVKRQ